jgi:hypothetical protein
MSNCSRTLSRTRDEIGRLVEVVEEVSRHVLAVDRLEQEVDAMLGQPVGGIGDGIAIARLRGGVLRVGEAGHHVDALHAGLADIGQRRVEAGAELRLAARQRGDATLASGEIARRQVEQRLLQLRARQRQPDLLGGMLIGKQELHRRETGIGRGFEAVEKLPFVEHHREIGGKARHVGL